MRYQEPPQDEVKRKCPGCGYSWRTDHPVDEKALSTISILNATIVGWSPIWAPTRIACVIFSVENGSNHPLNNYKKTNPKFVP